MPIFETWTYGVCEYCQKNMHEEVKMKKERVIGYNGIPQNLWVCPKCGTTKRL